MSTEPKGLGDSPFVPSKWQLITCRLSGHNWNDFARSWEKLDDKRARIQHKQCTRYKKWDYDQVVIQSHPSETFDSFTTDRRTIIGFEDDKN